MANDDWFISERASALATVLLTRRKDLHIQQSPGDETMHFVVTIRKDGSDARRFGVVLAGTPSAVTEEHANKVLRPLVQSYLRRGPVYVPVCLFYFTMEDDQGYYTWLIEPVQKGDRMVLTRNATPEAKKLSNASLEGIVQRVNKWYESMYESSVLTD